MKSGMVPVVILFVPVVAAFLLGPLYGPTVQALIPGNTIMTASDHTFQADTFSLIGSVGSLLSSPIEEVPYIVTGAWGLDVQNGNVTNFLADLSMISADGSGYRTVSLSNMTSDQVELHENGTATITGTLYLAINGTDAVPADAAISIAKLRAITMVIDSANVTGTFAGQPLYGIVDQPELQAASIPTDEETGLGLNNITEKLVLPELPNPFR